MYKEFCAGVYWHLCCPGIVTFYKDWGRGAASPYHRLSAHCPEAGTDIPTKNTLWILALNGPEMFTIIL